MQKLIRMNLKRFMGSLLFTCCFSALAISQTVTPSVGDNAPSFQAKDQFGKTVSLQKQLAKGKVIVFFYRGYWCPFCNKQLSAMQDSLTFFSKKNVSIIAITPEAPEFIKKTVDKTSAKFSILYDEDYAIMNKYGVAFSLDESAFTRMKNVGIDVTVVNNNKTAQLPVPAVFIINQQGVIEFVFFDPNYRHRPSVKELLEHL